MASRRKGGQIQSIGRAAYLGRSIPVSQIVLGDRYTLMAYGARYLLMAQVANGHGCTLAQVAYRSRYTDNRDGLNMWRHSYGTDGIRGTDALYGNRYTTMAHVGFWAGTLLWHRWSTKTSWWHRLHMKTAVLVVHLAI